MPPSACESPKATLVEWQNKNTELEMHEIGPVSLLTCRAVVNYDTEQIDGFSFSPVEEQKYDFAPGTSLSLEIVA